MVGFETVEQFDKSGAAPLAQQREHVPFLILVVLRRSNAEIAQHLGRRLPRLDVAGPLAHMRQQPHQQPVHSFDPSMAAEQQSERLIESGRWRFAVQQHGNIHEQPVRNRPQPPRDGKSLLLARRQPLHPVVGLVERGDEMRQPRRLERIGEFARVKAAGASRQERIFTRAVAAR